MKAVAAFLRLPAATRMLALEAMLFLVLARVLVVYVPMRRWRHHLETAPDPATAAGRAGVPIRGDTAGSARRWIRPAPRSRAIGARQVDRSVSGDPAQAVPTARRVTHIVRRVARHAPIQFVCLPQAMAAQWMLRRRGVPSRLVFGARREADAALAFHAWLSVAGEIVMGGREAATYSVFERPGAEAERLGRPVPEPDRRG